MGRRGWIAAAVSALVFVPQLRAATHDQIRRTIDRAKNYLYNQQLKDHTWEFDFPIHGDQKTGQTALAVYALLSAGESRQDPRLIPAIEYLKKIDTTGVYAVGVRCQVWLMLPQTPDVKAAMARDASILLKSVKRSGEGKGFYDYNPGGKNYSHSRSQYAVLGLWAAAQSGVAVPKEYWQLVEKAWVEDQDPSGGWAYYGKVQERYPVTPGMTAVGVATLFITGDYIGEAVRNPAIDRGINWLTENFSRVATDEKQSRGYPYSTLYAIERIGVAGGQKYFGTIDWYDKGADFLVGEQKSDGSFKYEFDGVKTASTCFAILFLTRGSSPLVMNKLDYSAATVSGSDRFVHWNQRPRDVANLSRWIGRQIERDLNWQVVNLDSPLDDLLDAQILYVAGNQQITLKAEHEAKLKAFIEAGGMILANADSASSNFANSIKALGKKLFPQYDFAPLADNHVIYTAEQFRRTDWKRKPAVLSMSNGVRELIIVLPDADASRAWQAQTPAGREEIFQLAADVFLYSVDKQNLRRRGESYLITRDDRSKATGSLPLARVQYDGNWDPEPGGWRRLAAVMHNTAKLGLNVEPTSIDRLTSAKLAHLTGTTRVTFDAAQRSGIKSFLDAGGTLIIDAAGGSSAFASSIESELAAIVPNAATQLADPLPPEHPLFKIGEKLSAVGYRTFARNKLGLIKVPQLRGIEINRRLAIIYSREDLSAGLVGQPVDGINGYDPATATALMSKIIEYAGSQRK